MSYSWQRTQEDLQQLRSDLEAVSMKCNSFLHQSPSGSSVPTLRTELNLVVEKMDHVFGLSTVYLNKWVSWGFGSKRQCYPLGWEGKVSRVFHEQSREIADLEEHARMTRDLGFSSKYGVDSYGLQWTKCQCGSWFAVLGLFSTSFLFN